jgi:hypothetical protein
VVGLLALITATSRSGMSQPATRAVFGTAGHDVGPVAGRSRPSIGPPRSCGPPSCCCPVAPGLLGFIGGLNPEARVRYRHYTAVGACRVGHVVGDGGAPPLWEQKPPAWKGCPGSPWSGCRSRRRPRTPCCHRGSRPVRGVARPSAALAPARCFRLLGSKTWIISRSAQLTKAFCGEPAKTTSAGSFSVVTLRTVAFGRQVYDADVVAHLVHTTHASLLCAPARSRGQAHGDACAVCKSPGAVTVKTSKVLFAVFTASNLVPSGVISIG